MSWHLNWTHKFRLDGRSSLIWSEPMYRVRRTAPSRGYPVFLMGDSTSVIRFDGSFSFRILMIGLLCPETLRNGLLRHSLVLSIRFIQEPGLSSQPSSVDDDIFSRHVCARLTGHENSHALEIIRNSPSPHRNAIRQSLIVVPVLWFCPEVFIDICGDLTLRNQYASSCPKPTTTHPGDTQFTLIPRPAHSLLSALVSCSTPPLLAE